MSNNGRKIVLTLRKRNTTTNTLTGDTKPNVPGDPDYIPPSTDLVNCPIDGDPLECPVVSAEEGGDNISYSFALPAGTLANPSLVTVQVVLKSSAPAVIATHSYTDFDPNYYASSFTGLAPGTYTIDIVLKDGGGATLATCTAAATVTVLAYQLVLIQINLLEVNLCASDPQSEYIAAGDILESGTFIFTNTALTLPLMGFNYIKLPNGNIHDLNNTTGEIEAFTGNTC